MTERHSLSVLNQIYQYDTFLDSIKTVADMGCGTGEDLLWWAKLCTRDEPPVPHNYKCYAVDKNPGALSGIPNLANIIKINKDFTQNNILPIKIDLMWSHNSLQYSTNPLETLRFWNEQMNVNGMLIISISQQSGVKYNQYYSEAHSGCYFDYTPCNLIYMLAVNGFDCKDAYLLKKWNDPWLQMAVYKSDVAPMDPKTTTWENIANKGLLHHTMVESINTYGYLRQQDILLPWLNMENYYVDWIQPATEIPEEAGEPIITGVINTKEPTDEPVIHQAGPVTADTPIINKPIGVVRPGKKYKK